MTNTNFSTGVGTRCQFNFSDGLPHVKQEFKFHYKFDQWNAALDNAAPLSLLPLSSIRAPFPRTSPSSPNQTRPKKNDR